MKFHNHKHNCYITAEGSFVGKVCEGETRDQPNSRAKEDTDSPKKYERILNDGKLNIIMTIIIVSLKFDNNYSLVHYKRKRIVAGLGSYVSTSPNMFWQIEKSSKPSSGMSIISLAVIFHYDNNVV